MRLSYRAGSYGIWYIHRVVSPHNYLLPGYLVTPNETLDLLKPQLLICQSQTLRTTKAFPAFMDVLVEKTSEMGTTWVFCGWLLQCGAELTRVLHVCCSVFISIHPFIAEQDGHTPFCSFIQLVFSLGLLEMVLYEHSCLSLCLKICLNSPKV